MTGLSNLSGAWVPAVDLNPFHWAGDQVEQSLADGFTAMMMSLWSAGLWLIDMVFGVIDQFTTPNLADPGLGHLYSLTLWVSLVTALLLGLGQVAVAAIRRDGRSLGALVVGVAQYGAVVTAWVSVCAVLVLGCAGLTRGVLHEMLHVDGFAGFSASAGLPDHVTGTVQSAVLGVCALFLLVPAAFGYLLITLVRESALLILTATMPIAAAGALGEGTRAWLWKSVRWFTAACLTAPLLALVVGLGVQISRAAFPDTQSTVATDRVVPGARLAAASQQVSSGGGAADVGMAVVGCVILLVACFCPMALFRLLAFVDPGTASGASFRSTLAANGGVSGLLSGRARDSAQGSGAASQVSGDGRAASETSADTETADRFTSRFTRAFGTAGKAAGTGMAAIGSVAAHGASMSVDVMGQSGVGHQGYYDTSPGNSPRSPATQGGLGGHGRRGAPRTRVGHGWDPHEGASQEPPHVGGVGGGNSGTGPGGSPGDSAGSEVADAAGGGVFLA